MRDFKKSVVYQIYPKSFKDTNGDGFGDLKGVTEKLDYLKMLGVDYIWLTPFYISPQKDNGYDVADYCSIDPRFGTMGDLEKLISEANVRGIDTMLDMVFNHTSVEHQWFIKALKGETKYKNYYIFKDPKEGRVPTNWTSKFGGSVWEYIPKFDEYYLHLFDVTQADLNWENEELRNEIYNVVNFWMDKGVKGFRLDVINLISKPDKLEDDLEGDGRKFYTDGPRIHEYLKELNKNTFGQKEGILTVGEMSSTTVENCIKYSNPNEEELSMVFNFHHLKVDYKNSDKWENQDFDFLKLKEIFNQWQVAMQQGDGWSAVFWCNHDQPRIVSRFGDDEKYHKESAKMLATTIHMMRGTPYIYQGEEIGMTNPYFECIDMYKDVESKNYFEILKGQEKDENSIIQTLQSKSRDNSRTPMQWDNSLHGGFTDGQPWIDVNKNYTSINVENALRDEDSIFYHYQKLVKLRRELDVIVHGSYQPILENHPAIFAYLRNLEEEKLLVVNNFYGAETRFELPKEIDINGFTAEVLISNTKSSPKDLKEFTLNPYESIVFHLVK